MVNLSELRFMITLISGSNRCPLWTRPCDRQPWTPSANLFKALTNAWWSTCADHCSKMQFHLFCLDAFVFTASASWECWKGLIRSHWKPPFLLGLRTRLSTNGSLIKDAISSVLPRRLFFCTAHLNANTSFLQHCFCASITKNTVIFQRFRRS